MPWFAKIARNERERVERNINRLKELKSLVHDLGYYAIASNSGGYQLLADLVEDNIVRGRPKVYNKLQSALIGENNQKVALDAPSRFQSIMIEAEELIKREIGKEQSSLRELEGDKKDDKQTG